MINLRYHIVSLVAVFLALGIGVVMGATVIDRAIVDSLNDRVNRVERSVRSTQAENGRLNDQLRSVRDFADQARDLIGRQQLEDVPVLLLAVEGVDGKSVEAVRQSLAEAQSTLAGTLWLTPKMRLENDADAQALAAALNVSIVEPNALRANALERLSATLTGVPVEPNPLVAMASTGFLRYDPPPGPSGPTERGVEAQAPNPVGLTVASLPLSGQRLVLVSGAGARVGDDQLAVPLAGILVRGRASVVAVEAGQDSPGGRGVFVGPLREDGDLAPHISTVDNLESSMGQAAAVLALGELGVPRTGHYGVGPGAQRLLPAPQT